MTNDELMQLKALAEAATVGPWHAESDEVWADAEHEACHPIRGQDWDNNSCRLPEDRARDAQYIAAANPAAILAMIAKVESLAADAERLDFVIEKGAFITWSLRDSTIKQCQLMNQDEDEDFHYLSGENKYFNTVRAAIDASMAKDKA